jgi:crossover junction endodeoxyribonuclease RusA
MKDDIVLYLPWPPTVNDYYKVTQAGQRYLDKKVRVFRGLVAKSIHEQAPNLHLVDPLFVEVYLFPPDLRKRDVDNYMKGLLDGITESKLWKDDSIIDQLHIFRGEKVKGGIVRMEISEAGPVLPFQRD